MLPQIPRIHHILPGHKRLHYPAKIPFWNLVANTLHQKPRPPNARNIKLKIIKLPREPRIIQQKETAHPIPRFASPILKIFKHLPVRQPAPRRLTASRPILKRPAPSLIPAPAKLFATFPICSSTLRSWLTPPLSRKYPTTLSPGPKLSLRSTLAASLYLTCRFAI
jgi:hypothetical protein